MPPEAPTVAAPVPSPGSPVVPPSVPSPPLDPPSLPPPPVVSAEAGASTITKLRSALASLPDSSTISTRMVCVPLPRPWPAGASPPLTGKSSVASRNFASSTAARSSK
ncbi:MAG: hypothetical protein U0168_05815 [Nannocystaceae bacterium]